MVWQSVEILEDSYSLFLCKLRPALTSTHATTLLSFVDEALVVADVRCPLYLLLLNHVSGPLIPISDTFFAYEQQQKH
jgi:hypothetical protein